MSELITAIEVLEEKITTLQERVWELEEENEKLEAYAKAKAWSRPREIEEIALPVPRLQIQLIENSEWDWDWFYSLVYRHTTGELLAVPMGETNSSGSHKNELQSLSFEDVMFALPFRDGVHIRRDAAQLNLEAYALVRGKAFELPKIEDC